MSGSACSPQRLGRCRPVTGRCGMRSTGRTDCSTGGTGPVRTAVGLHGWVHDGGGGRSVGTPVDRRRGVGVGAGRPVDAGRRRRRRDHPVPAAGDPPAVRPRGAHPFRAESGRREMPTLATSPGSRTKPGRRDGRRRGAVRAPGLDDLANLRAAHQNAVAGGLAGEAAVLVTSLHEYASGASSSSWATGRGRRSTSISVIRRRSRRCTRSPGGAGASPATTHRPSSTPDAASPQNGGRHRVRVAPRRPRPLRVLPGRRRGRTAHPADEIGRARASGDRYRLSYVLADSGVHAMLSGGGDGGVEVGRGRADEALALARGLGNPALVSMAQMAQGFAHQSTDPALAIDWFRRGAALADHVDSRWTAGICRGELALLLSLHGDPVEALGRALEQVRRSAGPGTARGCGRSSRSPCLRWSSCSQRRGGRRSSSSTQPSRPVPSSGNRSWKRPWRRCWHGIAATLGPDAMARSVAIGRGLDDATLFDMATATMEAC